MLKYNLNTIAQNKIVQVTDLFFANKNAKSTVILNEGGARSSKSYSVCQLFIYKMYSETHKNFLITRKTFPSLIKTAYKLFFDLLKKYKLYNKSCHDKTNYVYNFNDNYILFSSIDQPTKLQSTEFNYIWLEEAEEFSFDDFMLLKTRLSGKHAGNELNQMFLTYNPRKVGSYINRKIRFYDDITLIKSTYKNNPFLNAEYISRLENLKNQDMRTYSIYTLGEYSETEGQIFTNISSASSFPDTFEEIIYGLDFGFNNPSCLLQIGIKDNVYYVTELLYKSGLTNSDLLEFLKVNIPNKRSCIYADASEPARIEEIYRKGFDIKPADKDVVMGIDFLKGCKIYTLESNVHFNEEVNSYVYAKDKNGNLLDTPEKLSDHAMDALRYAIYTHHKYKKRVLIAFI